MLLPLQDETQPSENIRKLKENGHGDQQWCRFGSTDSFTLSCALGHRARIRLHMQSKGGNRNCVFGALTGHRVRRYRWTHSGQHFVNIFTWSQSPYQNTPKNRKPSPLKNKRCHTQYAATHGNFQWVRWKTYNIRCQMCHEVCNIILVWSCSCSLAIAIYTKVTLPTVENKTFSLLLTICNLGAMSECTLFCWV